MPLVQREIAVSAGPAVRAIKGTNPGLVGAAIRRASEEAGLQNGITDLGKYSHNEMEAAEFLQAFGFEHVPRLVLLLRWRLTGN
jgi:hypothetical protein